MQKMQIFTLSYPDFNRRYGNLTRSGINTILSRLDACTAHTAGGELRPAPKLQIYYITQAAKCQAQAIKFPNNL